MSRSFGLVEEKLAEADFFLEKLSQVPTAKVYEGRYYFSAFLSAARSITFAMQACLNGVADFDTWYDTARQNLKTDNLSKFFHQARNDAIHIGTNPLNEVPIQQLKEHLSLQLQGNKKNVHTITIPVENASEIREAYAAGREYLTSITNLIFECYQKYKTTVDPRWYFTKDNFQRLGKSAEDAVSELGFPQTWLSSFPEKDLWPIIRSQQPHCQANFLFMKYLGKSIAEPDDDEQCFT